MAVLSLETIRTSAERGDDALIDLLRGPRDRPVPRESMLRNIQFVRDMTRHLPAELHQRVLRVQHRLLDELSVQVQEEMRGAVDARLAELRTESEEIVRLRREIPVQAGRQAPALERDTRVNSPADLGREIARVDESKGIAWILGGAFGIQALSAVWQKIRGQEGDSLGARLKRGAKHALIGILAFFGLKMVFGGGGSGSGGRDSGNQNSSDDGENRNALNPPQDVERLPRERLTILVLGVHTNPPADLRTQRVYGIDGLAYDLDGVMRIVRERARSARVKPELRLELDSPDEGNAFVLRLQAAIEEEGRTNRAVILNEGRVGMDRPGLSRSMTSPPRRNEWFQPPELTNVWVLRDAEGNLYRYHLDPRFPFSAQYMTIGSNTIITRPAGVPYPPVQIPASFHQAWDALHVHRGRWIEVADQPGTYRYSDGRDIIQDEPGVGGRRAYSRLDQRDGTWVDLLQLPAGVRWRE